MASSALKLSNIDAYYGDSHVLQRVSFELGEGRLLARPGYALLAGAAVGSLPVWARWPLRLPYLPLTEATLVRAAGEGVVRGLRWALTPAA